LEAEDGAEIWMSTPCKAYDFALYPIFLGGEGECCKLTGEYGVIRCMVQVDVGPKCKELDITKCKGLVGGGVCTHVFTRLEEEIECNGDHISSGGMVGVVACLSHIGNVEKKGDWNGFDTVWWGVNLAIGSKLVVQAEVNFAMAVKAWVPGPHTKERLGNAL